MQHQSKDGRSESVLELMLQVSFRSFFFCCFVKWIGVCLSAAWMWSERFAEPYAVGKHCVPCTEQWKGQEESTCSSAVCLQEQCWYSSPCRLSGTFVWLVWTGPCSPACPGWSDSRPCFWGWSFHPHMLCSSLCPPVAQVLFFTGETCLQKFFESFTWTILNCCASF